MLCVWTLTGCGKTQTTQKDGSPDNSKQKEPEVTIAVTTNIVGEQAKVLEDIATRFMADNPGIKVDFTAPGKGYEDVLKVKMASNELPDVFSTHGWAKARYGKYLADLKDEEWASNITNSIKPIVTDESGKVYVLPMDEDKTGIVYNVDILNEYGVEIPKTFDEFLAACEQIKTKSGGKVIPVHIGGSDGWPEGQYYDFFATPALISPETNYQKELLDGTFDWSKFDILPEKFLEMWKKGYVNKDFLTSKYMDSVSAFAGGKAAFGFYGPYFIEEAKKTNPNIKGGMMPIPSMVDGDEPTFVGGEKTTWGVWKDSKNIDAAKKFVAYYAKPENIKLVAESNRLPAGIKDIDVDCGEMTPFYKQYSDIRVFPYFDRVYLPSGMWDVICKNAQDLVAGGITPQQFSQNMKKDYDRLRAQKQ
jgi:raffinose/stachyose/melibiose transport system substrate-binding protein